jgi:hypothetical protein
MIEGNGEGQGAMKEWQRWRMHNEACGMNMAKHGVLVKLRIIDMEVHYVMRAWQR